MGELTRVVNGQGKTTSHTAVPRREGGRLLKTEKDGSRWLAGGQRARADSGRPQ